MDEPFTLRPQPTNNVACQHCGRLIAAEGVEIHYCVQRQYIGGRLVAHREYVGTDNGLFVACGESYHEVETRMNEHKRDLDAQTRIDTADMEAERAALLLEPDDEPDDEPADEDDDWPHDGMDDIFAPPVPADWR